MDAIPSRRRLVSRFTDKNNGSQGQSHACMAKTEPTKAPRHLVLAYSEAMVADRG